MEEMISENAGILLEAIHFSAEKHRDQRRKDQSRTPYINHPIQVSQTLWRVGGVRELSTLTAAILHDTIEDTQTTAKELEDLFGSEILSIVLEVTDDKSLPKQMRKQLQVEHAAHISGKAKLVKLADKTCNLKDLLNSPPADWDLTRRRDYVLWSESVVAGLRGSNAPLEAHFDEILRVGKQLFSIGS